MSISDPALDVPGRAAGRMRVSDAEREAVAVRLRDAAAQGRLTLAEADERQGLAYAARTRDDLGPLTADLPQPTPEPIRRGPMSEDARLRLGLHGGVVALLSLFLVIAWALGPARWFWPAWPMLWLSVSLVLHYRRAQRAADRGHASAEG
jgi:Domain of unknown function (DUF1707)